jgi:hypothetical protein
MDVYSTELGILLIFGKNSEFRGGGPPPFGTPLLAWTGPGGSRKRMRPVFLNSRHMKVVNCQPYTPAAFLPQEIFMLESEWIIGHSAFGSIT